MDNIMGRFLVIASVVFLSGCLATVEESTYEGGKTVGKVLSIPSAASQGAADGLVKDEKHPNPYKR